ncbi:MAG: hypothetical protein KDB63_01945 [Nocardioidaceae bacterium]|nr:hypothetical protein [Nocardioidaceae bacterium]
MNTPTTIVSISLAALVVAGTTTGASGETTTHHRTRWSEHSRVTADVDGDGRLDTAVQLTRGESGTHSRVKVFWATGGSAAVRLPFSGYERLELGLDLDGDGSQELVLTGSGGESTWWQVVAESDHRLTRVRTINAAGRPTPLAGGLSEGTGAPQNRSWHTDLLAAGFFDFRFVEAHPTAPAPIRVRRWELSGRTLTRSATTEPGCYGADGYLGVNLGTC